MQCRSNPPFLLCILVGTPRTLRTSALSAARKLGQAEKVPGTAKGWKDIDTRI